MQLQWINEFLVWAQRIARNETTEIAAVTWVMDGWDEPQQITRNEIIEVAENKITEVAAIVRTRNGWDESTVEENVFGYQEMKYPTRRPIRRPLSTGPIRPQARYWFEESKISVESEVLSPKQMEQVIKLLYTWKDLFVEKISDLPATDLVWHTIPTYPRSRPYKAKDPIYAADEV